MEKYIFLGVGGLATLMLLLFKRKNLKFKKRHEHRSDFLKVQLEINNKQIQKRHYYLSIYKYLEYNLEASLFVQEEIDLQLKQ